MEADETIERIIDYCFDHATSQNPVQELIDAGLISDKFVGYDCKSIQFEKSNRTEQQFVEQGKVKWIV